MIPSPERPRWRLVAALGGAMLLVTCLAASAQTTKPAPRTDLDILMEDVLANRDKVWQHLRDYVLDERERFALLGPDGARLFGQDRSYTWYARDGMGVRSPVAANGAAVSDDERRRYEDDWIRDEQARETRRRERDGNKAGNAEPPASDAQPSAQDDPAAPTLANSLEPRFVSESFFLRFRFEPGNYYFAGRDTIDGREVLKVEYLPTKLYADNGEHASHQPDKDEAEIERKMNKVALVTLWIDRDAKQVVRYTFDNVDFGFLPGRSLVRVDGARASMTMGSVLDGVWMPRTIVMDGEIALATGTFRIDYHREFSGYRRGQTSATIVVREEH